MQEFVQELQFAKRRAWRYATASTHKLAVAKRRCSAGCRKSLYGDLLTVEAAIAVAHRPALRSVVMAGLLR